jgi:uncharacterized protein YcgI (DUF1989 family)
MDTAQGPGTRAHALQQFDGLEPLQHLLVKNASAQAYAVKAGQYIQIVDVDGKQCTDFQCFSQAKLDQGLQLPLDVTTTRTLMADSERARSLARLLI